MRRKKRPEVVHRKTSAQQSKDARHPEFGAGDGPTRDDFMRNTFGDDANPNSDEPSETGTVLGLAMSTAPVLDKPVEDGLVDFGYGSPGMTYGGEVVDPKSTPGFSLFMLSRVLDEKIRDAEDYLAGLAYGVEAKVPVSEYEGQPTEPGAALAFRRLKEGWHLMYGCHRDLSEESYHEFELTKVSRQRKLAGLAQLGELVRQISQEGANTERQIQAAIDHIDEVIAKGVPK